jgi:Family of unknown function (DUF6510)
MDPLMLDGNAVAGLLQEVFATEMTIAVATCGTCGAREPLCLNVLGTIVKGEGDMTMSLVGVRALSIPPDVTTR